MQEPFTHYIITRFNLRKEAWKTSRDGARILTEEWLNNRFQLFEDYCFQSIKSQTNKNFQWLVFFDKNTSGIYKKKIAHFHEQFQNFIPIYAKGMVNFVPGIKREISECKTPYLLTTRLDNDDCVSQHFVDKIQNNFEKRDFMGIDFPNGYTLQVEPQVKIGKRKQIFNPFMSVVEKNQHPETIWREATHSGWKKEKNIKRINEERIWMSIIHAENKKNDFRGYGKVSLATILREFNIKDPLHSQLLEREQVFSQKQSLSNRIKSNRKVLNKDLKRNLGWYK